MTLPTSFQVAIKCKEFASYCYMKCYMCCKYGREVRDRDGIASRIGSEPRSYLHMIDKLTDESKQEVPWTMFPEDIVIFSRKSGC